MGNPEANRFAQPAYPHVSTKDIGIPGRLVEVLAPGVTIVDYFAARAPEPPEWWLKLAEQDETQKVLKNDLYVRKDSLDLYTEWAYSYAKSMMKARPE